jgi:hypothetical protein
MPTTVSSQMTALPRFLRRNSKTKSSLPQSNFWIHLNSLVRHRHSQNLAERLDLDIISCDGTAARFDPSQALYRLTDALNESDVDSRLTPRPV